MFAFYNGVILLNNPSEKEYPVRGVDVSSYQKATEGSGRIDKYFKNNFNSALKTNLTVGAYHFFSFDSTEKNR